MILKVHLLNLYFPCFKGNRFHYWRVRAGPWVFFRGPQQLNGSGAGCWDLGFGTIGVLFALLQKTRAIPTLDGWFMPHFPGKPIVVVFPKIVCFFSRETHRFLPKSPIFGPLTPPASGQRRRFCASFPREVGAAEPAPRGGLHFARERPAGRRWSGRAAAVEAHGGGNPNRTKQPQKHCFHFLK